VRWGPLPFGSVGRPTTLLPELVGTMHPDILLLHADIEERHWWFVSRRLIVAQVLRSVLPTHSGCTVLDLGCGTGGNLGALASEYACTGVELDGEAVRFAKNRYPEVDFHEGSILDPGAWPVHGKVDACLLMDVLEHLDDDRGAIRSATKFLKPGGHLLITVPAEPALWSRHDEYHEHRRRYMPADIRALLSDLPLAEVLITGFNARLFWPIKLWRWVQAQVPLLRHRGTTGDLHMPPAIVNRLLTWVLAGESVRVQASLNESGLPYPRGVSLLALLRKLPNG